MARRRELRKEESQRIHVKVRAAERFGLNLVRRDIDAIVTEVREGRAEFLGRQSNRLSVFRVRYQGAGMKIVYDSNRQTLASVLTEDMPITVIGKEVPV